MCVNLVLSTEVVNMHGLELSLLASGLIIWWILSSFSFFSMSSFYLLI